MPLKFVSIIASIIEKREFLKGRRVPLFAKAHGWVAEHDRFVPKIWSSSSFLSTGMLLFKQEPTELVNIITSWILL